MTISLEGGFLARRRGERGEGEVGRITERVNRFDDEMQRDAESFPEVEDEELKKIRGEAKELVEKTRKALGLKIKEWATRNSIVKMAAVAGTSVGIHAALLSHPMEDGEMKRKWEEEGAVIRLQSQEEQEMVQQKITEREARIDHAALASYKTVMSQKIERGEPVTFTDLYFSLEEKNGVLPEDVAEARQGAQKMIDVFSADVGDELSEGEIKDIVQEMYGEKDNYDAGQASVTEYFKAYNQGKKPKRNCVTIDRAEQIVFEGIVTRLPKEEGKKFSIGEMTVKQHKIATLTWRDGSEERLFPLEPDQPERTVQPEAGIAKVDASFLKIAAVAEKPLRVSAGKGEVPPSPDIEAKTNEPFSSGYTVDGPLIASDFVRAEVIRKGIQIENKKDQEEEWPIDLDGLEGAKQLKQEVGPDGALPIWKLKQPSPEAIKEFNAIATNVRSIELGEMKEWSPQQMRDILDETPYDRIAFTSGISESLRPVLGVKHLSVPGEPSPVYLFRSVTFSPGPESGYPFAELSEQDAERVLNAFPRAEVRFSTPFTFNMLSVNDETFRAMKRAHVRKFYFDGVPSVIPNAAVPNAPQGMPEGAVWKEMSEFASPVELSTVAYLNAVMDHPEYWRYKNIEPSFDGVGIVLADPRVVAYLQDRHPEQETEHQKYVLDGVSATLKNHQQR